jgi:hypothetical protein
MTMIKRNFKTPDNSIMIQKTKIIVKYYSKLISKDRFSFIICGRFLHLKLKLLSKKLKSDVTNFDKCTDKRSANCEKNQSYNLYLDKFDGKIN